MYAKLAFGNVRKSLRSFSIYFLTTVLGIAVFYAFNAIASQDATGAVTIYSILGMLIDGVSVFIAIILFFLVLYANRFLLRRRKKEFGLYLLLGMQRGDVVKITLIETMLVGVLSLVVGILVGFGISQLLMLVSNALLQMEVPGFIGGFSESSLAKTLIVFVVIFAVTAVVNTGSVMKTRLIDLMQSDRKNEEMRLRSLPFSLALFIASCIMIGVAYYLLIQNGLMNASPQFLASTILVCLGTLLFFYSLSGFLLRLVQAIKPLYYRGLNMFSLRQLNSKVNTAFLSMSVVCMTLFLAITSVCGGIGICNALNSSLEKSTSYDATVQTNYGSFTTAEGFRAFLPEPLEDFAEAHDYRILDGLRDSGLAVVATFNDSWITDSVQLDFVFSTEKPLTFSNLDSLSDRPLGEYTASIINPDYPQQAVDLVALSQVNKALEMAGKAPLPVDAGECALIFDADPAAEYVRHLAEKAPILPIGDSDLKVIGAYEESLVTTSFPLNVCTVVVPDGSLPANTTIAYSVLDVLCPSEDAQKSFGEYCMAIQESDNLNSWPISNAMTKSEIYAQSVGLSTVVAYLAIYIGFVLVVACAAILAIQQLSEAGDNAKRYHLLGKLGASRPMLNRALLLQIAIYFLFPLALALAHSICALQVVTDVVSVFGHLDIGFMALVCTAAFLATYGVYFIMTYVSAKRLIRA